MYTIAIASLLVAAFIQSISAAPVAEPQQFGGRHGPPPGTYTITIPDPSDSGTALPSHTGAETFTGVPTGCLQSFSTVGGGSIAGGSQNTGTNTLSTATGAITQNTATGAITQNTATGAITQNTATGAITQNTATEAITQNTATGAITQNTATGAITQNTATGTITLTATDTATQTNTAIGSSTAASSKTTTTA